MLKNFNFLVYKFRADTVKTGKMIDSRKIHYPLYPLSQNIERILGFSGTPGSVAITPLEISDFLHQLSNENLDLLRKSSIESENTIKTLDKQVLPLRLYNFVINPEYRYRNLSKRRLEEKENFIKLSLTHLKKLLRSTKVANLPVGVASNTIYSAVKLNLDISSELKETLIPLLSTKLQHLHLEGAVETLWGLASINYNDKEILNKLISLIESKKGTEYKEVLNSPYNHLEYIYNPHAVPRSTKPLLIQAGEIIEDQDLKTKVLQLADSYK
jgi:hypothetical protein